MLRSMTLFFVILLCLSRPNILASSQTGDGIRQYTTFHCDFDTSSVRILKAQGTEVERSDSMRDITFAQIDYDAQRALMVGNNGSTPLLVVLGAETLHLVEFTSIDDLITTTIFSRTGKLTSVGSVSQMVFRAAMSRHVAGLAPEAIVSQHYGACRALR